MALPAGRFAHFHVIEQGSGWLRVEGETRPRRLGAGDLIVLPHGQGHSLSDAPETPLVPFARIRGPRPFEGPRLLRHGGDGVRTRLVCGAFRWQGSQGHPLLAALPSVLHIPRGSKGARGLDTILDLLEAEAREPRPGTEALLSRLTDLLFVEALRSWIETSPAGSRGFMLALADRHVGGALTLIHRQPDRPWTLASLGAEVGMSRSRFSERWKALVGEPPLVYLRRFRLQLGAERLRADGDSLADVAAGVGYESETGFAKAFRKAYGRSPAAYRRQAKA